MTNLSHLEINEQLEKELDKIMEGHWYNVCIYSPYKLEDVRLTLDNSYSIHKLEKIIEVIRKYVEELI